MSCPLFQALCPLGGATKIAQGGAQRNPVKNVCPQKAPQRRPKLRRAQTPASSRAKQRICVFQQSKPAPGSVFVQKKYTIAASSEKPLSSRGVHSCHTRTAITNPYFSKDFRHPSASGGRRRTCVPEIHLSALPGNRNASGNSSISFGMALFAWNFYLSCHTECRSKTLVPRPLSLVPRPRPFVSRPEQRLCKTFFLSGNGCKTFLFICLHCISGCQKPSKNA